MRLDAQKNSSIPSNFVRLEIRVLLICPTLGPWVRTAAGRKDSGLFLKTVRKISAAFWPFSNIHIRVLENGLFVLFSQSTEQIVCKEWMTIEHIDIVHVMAPTCARAK